MKTRFNVRRAIRELMADRQYGFLAQFERIAESYGLSEIPEIDWNPGSRNFAQVNLQPEDALERFQGNLPGCLLYTTVSNSPGAKIRFNSYSGEILAHLDFYRATGWTVGDEPTLEGEDMESVADAYEMAAYMVMSRADIRWPDYGVTYDANLTVDRTQNIILVGDGYHQIIPVFMAFQIDLD